MPRLSASTSPVFDVPGLAVTGFASPSRGAKETSVWRLTIPPGSPGLPHSVTREEIFVILDGTAEATMDGEKASLAAGDTLIVPPHTEFTLANPGTEPFTAMAVLPVGGQARVGDDEPFTPPWAS